MILKDKKIHIAFAIFTLIFSMFLGFNNNSIKANTEFTVDNVAKEFLKYKQTDDYMFYTIRDELLQDTGFQFYIMEYFIFSDLENYHLSNLRNDSSPTAEKSFLTRKNGSEFLTYSVRVKYIDGNFVFYEDIPDYESRTYMRLVENNWKVFVNKDLTIDVLKGAPVNFRGAPVPAVVGGVDLGSTRESLITHLLIIVGSMICLVGLVLGLRVLVRGLRKVLAQS